MGCAQAAKDNFQEGARNCLDDAPESDKCVNEFYRLGSVIIRYNPSRGKYAQDTEVTDPVDFFSVVFEVDYDKYQSMYKGLNAQKQAELNDIFGGVPVMENSAVANFWKA